MNSKTKDICDSCGDESSDACDVCGVLLCKKCEIKCDSLVCVSGKVACIACSDHGDSLDGYCEECGEWYCEECAIPHFASHIIQQELKDKKRAQINDGI